MLETRPGRGPNVGSVYITDQRAPSNPYGNLPSYFDQEVAAVAAAAVRSRPRWR